MITSALNRGGPPPEPTGRLRGPRREPPCRSAAGRRKARRAAALPAVACSLAVLGCACAGGPAASANAATAATSRPAAASPVPSAPTATSPAPRPTASATGTTPAPERQIAVATLSSFKVVLTATRSPGHSADPSASVNAAGYTNTAKGWTLIATKTIGKPNEWFWYSVSVCGLTVTQLKPEPGSAAPSDTVTVTLLMTPALGCSGAITEDFGHGA